MAARISVLREMVMAASLMLPSMTVNRSGSDSEGMTMKGCSWDCSGAA